jgi:hypothetical protein
MQYCAAPAPGANAANRTSSNNHLDFMVFSFREMKMRIAVAAALTAVGCLTAGGAGGYFLAREAPLKAAVATVSKRKVSHREVFQEIRELSAAMEPRLKNETDKLRVALLLRNTIYWRTPFSSDPAEIRVSDYDWFDIEGTFKKTVLDPRYGHWCGGRTIVLLFALRAFEIPARKIGLYAAVSDVDLWTPTHASVEALIGGEWIALDSTFNFSLRDVDGRYIGWLRAADLLKEGNAVLIDRDGFAEHPEFTFEEYSETFSMSLRKITAFWNVSSYRVDNTIVDGRHSPNWDGTLYYKNGNTFAAAEVDGGHIYRFIAEIGR